MVTFQRKKVKGWAVFGYLTSHFTLFCKTIASLFISNTTQVEDFVVDMEMQQLNVLTHSHILTLSASVERHSYSCMCFEVFGDPRNCCVIILVSF